ncbi:hypothetical protein HPSH112_07235 [Helicobacter pylori Shi112]|nr:hypothetical protein HPSH112_07235 [Helicobacter pylori Shi112]
MKRKHDKNSWLVLYIKISFKGFKVIFSIISQSSPELKSLGICFAKWVCP